MVENRAELKVCPGLDSLWRLELKHSLQTVHTQANFWWTGRSEMLRKAEKGEIPALRGLYVWRHFPRQQQVFLRCGQTAGLPGLAARDPLWLAYDFKNLILCQPFCIWFKKKWLCTLQWNIWKNVMCNLKACLRKCLEMWEKNTTSTLKPLYVWFKCLMLNIHNYTILFYPLVYSSSVLYMFYIPAII